MVGDVDYRDVEQTVSTVAAKLRALCGDCDGCGRNDATATMVTVWPLAWSRQAPVWPRAGVTRMVARVSRRFHHEPAPAGSATPADCRHVIARLIAPEPDCERLLSRPLRRAGCVLPPVIQVVTSSSERARSRSSSRVDGDCSAAVNHPGDCSGLPHAPPRVAGIPVGELGPV